MYKFLPLWLACCMLPKTGIAQCPPQLLNCTTAIQACDVSPNDANYWNEVNWWDNLHQSHDLAETLVDLNLALRDTCPGGDLSIRCLLFLDLDGNGTLETVVDSDNPPSTGQVNFDNALLPGYLGGIPRYFDQRALLVNQKWHFVLNTSISGDTSRFSLQWVSDVAPSNFVLPELPLGTHKVRWIITKGSGLETICEKSFTVKDCLAPEIVCINGLSVNIMPTQMIQLWASDFLAYTEDNVTQSPDLKLSLRKSGTGTGFPVDANGNPVSSIEYDCTEQGTQSVELWSIDLAGNANFCETYVIVQDNLGACEPGNPVSVNGCIETVCNLNYFGEVIYNFEVQVPNEPTANYFELGDNCISQTMLFPPNATVTITPVDDDNPLNGVTTFDLTLIQHVIDGIDQFSSPFAWIAADANRDQQVDSLDVEACKNLILGIYTELPNNSSWRFVDKSYVFPTPNPLSAPFPESVIFDSNNPGNFSADFVAVKICDINCTSVVGFFDLKPEAQHLIGEPSPNPGNGGAMLPIQLVEPEMVSLDLMDLSGRILFQQQLNLPQGPAMLEIPASAMTQAGLYVWRLRAGESFKTGKLVRQ